MKIGLAEKVAELQMQGGGDGEGEKAKLGVGVGARGGEKVNGDFKL